MDKSTNAVAYAPGYYIRDILPGTQQNMLRTVTSVSGALSEYIEDIRV